MTSLEKGMIKLSIDFSDEIIDRLNKYYEILIHWNSFMNLTNITEYEEVVVKHFIDSLSIVKVFPEIMNGAFYRIIDIGTGAGFPGLPLNIVFQNTELVLMDSLNKRINFLNYVISELKLTNIRTIHSRAEESAHKIEYREKFDICVSRAVAKMTVLSEYCIPFLKMGGYFIPYKSGKCIDEINEAGRAVKILGGKLIKTERFKLPDTDMERMLVLIKKEKDTPDIYPRPGGKMLRYPLIN